MKGKIRMKKGEVVSVVNMAGEYVGRIKEESSTKLVLENPRMVVNGDQGMGFAMGVCVTGKENPEEVSFYTAGIVFVTPVNEDIEKAYITATSGIII